MRILIANRGEIARRVMRTVRRMGHEAVAAYADPDIDAPFVHDADMAVRLGPASLRESYLDIDRYLQVMTETGAAAVHPGYGFLSENAAFAQAVIDAGFIWIGPNADVIDGMGSKIEARAAARAAGLPIIPGFSDTQDPAALAAAAADLGYPVLVKAAAGGGGKGIRIVHRPEDFADGLADAATEAERAFGDRAMIVERYIQRPRHVEVQIIGDRHGNVIHLGTRECSVQRRYQKVLEEAPAPNLPAATRAGVQDGAVALAKAMGYDSAGTIEYVVDDETGHHFFLEMNTRLQVEHTVTEEVTGLDLVELMIGSACGEVLPIGQDDVQWAGHAFEARINAEDPNDGFSPRVGTVSHLVIPNAVRWDSAVEMGSEITPHYDSMVAKLVVHGADRARALQSLGDALEHLVVGGVSTNTGFLRWLVDQAPVREGRVTTRFLDETPPGPRPDPPLVDAAKAWVAARRAASDDSLAWSTLTGFRVTPHPTHRVVGLRDDTGTVHEVTVEAASASVSASTVSSVHLGDRSVAVNDAGYTSTFTIPPRTERWVPSGDAVGGHARSIAAPFPALVAEVQVAPGEAVIAGQPLIVLEAMKMLHTLEATGPGTVDEVRVAAGDQVASNQVLVTFTDPTSRPSQEQPK